MSPALIISGRVPQEMARLAKEYYAFYDGAHVKVIFALVTAASWMFAV